MTKRRRKGGDDSPGLFKDLLPDPSKFKMKGRVLSLDQIILPDEKIRASSQFVNSVKTYGGIFEPIVVQYVEGEDKFRIREGRRRFWTLYDLVEAGTEGIQAKIAAHEIVGLPLDLPDEVIGAAVSLMLNHMRGDNIVADAASLKTLIQFGATESDITELTGMPLQTLQKTLRFNNLIPALARALNENRIAPSVAEAAAKFPKDVQEGLALLLKQRLKDTPKAKRDGVRLTMDDVRQQRTVRQRQAVDQVDGSLFDELLDDAEPVYVSAYKFHADQIERLMLTLPASTPQKIRTQFEKLHDALVQQGEKERPEVAVAAAGD